MKRRAIIQAFQRALPTEMREQPEVVAQLEVIATDIERQLKAHKWRLGVLAGRTRLPLEVAHSPELANIVATLTGKTIRVQSGPFSFGSANQFGDISIGTVVNGNMSRCEVVVQAGGALQTVLFLLPFLLIIIGIVSGVLYSVISANPPPVEGDVRIGVAAFEGNDGTDAAHMSMQFYDLLQATLREAKESESLPYSVSVVSPSTVGVISAAEPGALALMAEKRAIELDADILITGSLDRQSGGSIFTPRFYLSEHLLRDAEELAGLHPLGEQIVVADDIESNVVARDTLRRRLLARTKSLAHFIAGLHGLKAQQYELAVREFKTAEQLIDWPGTVDRELYHLFLAKAYTRNGDLALAEDQYRLALEANPQSARPMLAVAEMQFQHARGTCQADTTQVDLVEQAIQGYKQALTAPDPGSAVTIPTKVAFFVGRAHACLALAGLKEHREPAYRYLRAVTEAYQSADTFANDIRAESYFNLGVLVLSLHEPDQREAARREALDAFAQMKALAGPVDRRAFASLWLAHIYYRQRDCDSGDQALSEAEAMMSLYAQSVDLSYDEYNAFRDRVELTRNQEGCGS